MKRIIVLIFTVALMFSCVACMKNDAEIEGNIDAETKGDIEADTIAESTGEVADGEELFVDIPIVDEDKTRYISNSTDSMETYPSFEALDKAAPFVLTGVCISSRPVFQNETLYTLLEIKVEKSYRGKLSPGDTILIVELGGRTTFGEYEKGCGIEEKAFEQGGERLPDDYKLVIGDDGYFPLQGNEQVLLFLGEDSGFLKEVTEPLYYILNLYDGRLFLQEDGSYARPLPGQTDKLEFGEGTLRITAEQLSTISK